MTLAVAEIEYEHREVVLRDKPPELLQASPKGTVPVMVLNPHEPDRRLVLEESLDIMNWALDQRDPESWRASQPDTRKTIERWLLEFEQQFKPNLDAYKYRTRQSEPQQRARLVGETILSELNVRLGVTRYLFGNQLGYADVAVFPFIRQWANVDPHRFHDLNLAALARWLDAQLQSPLFQHVMQKHPRWTNNS